MTQKTPTQKKFELALLETGFFDKDTIALIAENKLSAPKIKTLVEQIKKDMFHAGHPVSQRYVLGIATDPAHAGVLLVLKNRPDWQAGLLNGIGGKIESGETPDQAIVREFYEETGIRTDFTDEEDAPTWKFIGKRSRKALFDEQPGSFEVYVYAVEIDREVLLAADRVSVKHVQANPLEEQIVYIPVNLEVFRRRGVSGLPNIIDLCLCSLIENFNFDIADVPNWPDSDD